MDKGKVLILESQNGSPISVSKILEGEGYATVRVNQFDEVCDLAIDEKPGVVLLDLDLNTLEGLEVCMRLKDDFETKKVTLVLLSSNNEEDYVVRAFDCGADDFITKPYGQKEIAARIRAIMRRVNRDEMTKIKVKDIEIDLDEHKVFKGGKSIDLTYIQFKLLYLLASRRENVFSRKEILEKVWGRKVYVTNRTVDVHIKRLREKLGEYKYPSQYIETIHGTGYRFM
ncbi:MAG: winged helix-turn-helix domain-containing protein [candidate division KSB1 bacterium]|nr:winged helix-turn-helix domain-containing protein [candidate division KSB1 bacterium]